MFEIDPERRSLPLSPERVLALVASLNTPNVVAANLPAEPTRCYICAYRETGEGVGFSIYLHCVDSEKGTFYRHEDRLLSRSRYDEVMAEALAFAESLGFMMDDLGFRDLLPARQRELIEQTPLFHEPRPPAARSTEETEGDAGGGPAAGLDAPAPAAPAAPPAPVAPAAPPAPVAAAAPPAPVAAAAPTPSPVSSVAAARPAADGPGVLAAAAAGAGRDASAPAPVPRGAASPRARAAAPSGGAAAGGAAVRALIRLLASL